MSCPKCGQSAAFHSHRPINVVSLLGDISLRRAYYYCRRCGAGCFPFDDEVGLSPHRLTPGAERVVSLLGTACDAFEEAAQTALPEACGLRLGESTVRRTCEHAGARLGHLLEDGHTVGRADPWRWHPDAKGRTCAYVSVDLVSVPQQADGGGPAESRMAYTAMVYNPTPESPKNARGQAEALPTPGYRPVDETAAPAQTLPGSATQAAEGVKAKKRPRMQARYLAGLYTLAELGLQLRRQAAHVGMELAVLWIALSDGGSGLEDFLRQNFNRPDLIIILDFWHPSSYLEALARAWHPNDEEQRQRLAQSWCHTMKHHGGKAILEVLQGVQLPKGKTVREAHADAVRYIGNNVHRMDYPYYLSQGWQIGSGPVESACKTVVSQRLKLAGMRWREYGTDSMCHLRALLRSGKDQWQAFWERHVN